MIEFKDIPQEIIEQYGLLAWDNTVVIGKPVYISIKNPNILETIYTYEFQSHSAYVSIYKEVIHVHATIF